MQTFEQYLQEQFLKDNPQVTKDNFEVAFDAWLERLEKSDILNSGERALSEHESYQIAH